MKGPILCFVGPPGVGKTSLGQSIARAMNRKFVRISLGGVRDEAEIRGHRRTYIGSMPGRIVQALRQAGAAEPGVHARRDGQDDRSASRATRRPRCSKCSTRRRTTRFRDHYLEVPFDLSRTLFIATANQLGTLHPALLDRMEVIQLSGYSEEEKLHIARRYLIPRQVERARPQARACWTITDAALRRVITRVHARGRRPQPRAADWRDRTEGRRAGSRAARRRTARRRPRPSMRPSIPEFLGPPRIHQEVVVPHVAARRRHRRGLDGDRRRRAVHRSHAAAGRAARRSSSPDSWAT